MKQVSSLILLVSLAILLSGALGVQEDSQEKEKEVFYRLTSNLVAIPVYVTDANGQPVRGLSKGDFEVFEGRRKCDINAVEFIDHTKATLGTFQIIPPESRRQFLLLFDLTFSNLSGLNTAREAGIDFLLKKTAPTDLVAVVAVSQRGGVSLLCPFTSKRSQAVQAISSLGTDDPFKYMDPAGFAYGSELEAVEAELRSLSDTELDADDIRATAQLENQTDAALAMQAMLEMAKSADRSRYSGMVRRYIDVLQALTMGLNMLHGRKNVIFFSEGFDNSTLTGASLDDLARESESFATMTTSSNFAGTTRRSTGSGDMQSLFSSLTKALRRSGSIIYAVDIGRLAAGAKESQKTRFSGQSTLFMFADGTNGEVYKNVNDLSKAIDDIVDRTSVGYLVAFKPSKPGKPGDFRKVKIKVKRSGLRVNHQEGYYFEKIYSEFSPQEKAIQLGEFVSKDILSQRISFDFDVQAFHGNDRLARIPIIVQINGEDLVRKNAQRKNPNIQLEIYGYLLDAENRPLDFFYETLSMPIAQASKRLQADGLKYYGLLIGEKGDYKVKCIVRDSELGNISSKIGFVTVPDFGEKKLAMCGPVFIDTQSKTLSILTAADQKAEGRRQGQPVDYPYVWNESRWIPDLNPELGADGKATLYVRIHNLMLHPQANVPQVQMQFTVIDESGTSYKIKRIGLADRKEDTANGIYDLMFQVDVSEENFAPGQYKLRFKFTDSLAKEDVESEIPFRIASR